MKSIRYYLKKSKMSYVKFNILALLIVSVSFSGCSDLKETPYTFIDPGNYYKTSDELESALTSVYSDFRSIAGNYTTLMALELVTEHAMPAHLSKDGVRTFNCWQGVNQSTTYNIQIWDEGYQLINRCNVVLGRGDGVNVTDEERSHI